MSAGILETVLAIIAGLAGIASVYTGNKVKAMEDALRTTRESIETLEATLDQLQEENARLTARVLALESENEKLRAENAGQRDRIKHLELQLEGGQKWNRGRSIG